MIPLSRGLNLEEVGKVITVGILAHVICPSDFDTARQRGSELDLVSFADTNYARKDIETRSVSGREIICAGACVRWISGTHKTLTS